MPFTDRRALDRFRRRARTGDAWFLQERAADDVQERLLMVKRAFTAAAIITPFPQIWENRISGARIIDDTDVLDLNEAAHDLIVHALCLHWADDPVGQLIQARKALRPDGLFIATLFGGQTLTELRSALAEAEIAVTGGLSPRVLPMGEIRDLGGLMQRAGFTLPVADSDTTTVSYGDTLALMRDLRAMGEVNAMQDRPRNPTRRTIFGALEQSYRNAYATDDARLPATFEILTLTGWAPGPEQPQPLRPGSATQRLADALSTTETRLSDTKTEGGN